jgi:hypothetical protein
VTTKIPPLPSKIDEKKESKLVNKFREYRQFNANWAERDGEGWINYREKNYHGIIIPLAIKSKILYYTDKHKVNTSFSNQFIGYMIKTSKARCTINDNELDSLASIEYYTTTTVANYLGLTYKEFYNLTTKDPDKLRVIFDLGEVVHRLINYDFYERLALAQEEQMKDRAEWKKRILRK